MTGLINPKDVGTTMTHEHLTIDFDVAYLPTSGRDKGNENLDFTMRNLGWIRQNPYVAFNSTIKLTAYNHYICQPVYLQKNESCVLASGICFILFLFDLKSTVSLLGRFSESR